MQYSNQAATPSGQTLALRGARRHVRHLAGALSLWVLAGLLTTTGQAQVFISDGTFAAADWTQEKLLDTTAGGDVSVISQQVAVGGNPGAYRQVTLQFASAGDVASGYFWTGGSYRPAASGPIASLSWTADLRGDPAIPNAAFGISLVLEQSATYYRYWGHQARGDSWQSFADTELTASDLFLVGDPASPLHPDFSATGGPIRFGFLIGKQDDPSSGPLNTGIDNFQVTLVAIPEAGSFAMCGAVLLGGLALARRCRRNGSI